MRDYSLRDMLLAALVPLLVLSIGISISESQRHNEINLTGIVIFLYLAIPVTLFTFVYVALLNQLQFKSTFLSPTLIGQLTLSLTLGVIFLTLWILIDASSYHYFEMGFLNYWLREFKRSWTIVVGFGLTIPIILNLSRSFRKREG
jgi:hypothetical protein